MSELRPAAEILRLESIALPPILADLDEADFDRPTVCTGWSIRGVLAHCGAALSRVSGADLHRFTPAENQIDVDARAAWPVAGVIAELMTGYESAVIAIDAATDASLDGVGLGEWMHGGDIRDALGMVDAYTSAGSDLAVGLIIERSQRLGMPAIQVSVDGERHLFGVGEVGGAIETDRETFVRLTGGRRPARERATLDGVSPDDLVLFG